MSLRLLFWILLLLWAVFGMFELTRNEVTWRFYVPNLFLFVLFVIVGWKLFGRPIEG